VRLIGCRVGLFGVGGPHLDLELRLDAAAPRRLVTACAGKHACLTYRSRG
jgi:hypothetical protein